MRLRNLCVQKYPPRSKRNYTYVYCSKDGMSKIWKILPKTKDDDFVVANLRNWHEHLKHINIKVLKYSKYLNINVPRAKFQRFDIQVTGSTNFLGNKCYETP